MIKVLFFGPVAERVGTSELQVEFRAGISLQDLRGELRARYPTAFEVVCFAAVNGEHVLNMSQLLAENCEVAFMARFSGG